MTENGKAEIPPSVVVVTFAAPGSAEFSVEVQRAGPTQLLAAAAYLRLMAERQIHEGWTAQAMAQARQQQDLARVQQMMGRKVQ